MWKDFFYFNKGEKRAIIVLTLLIIMAQAALWTTDYWIPLLPEKITHYSANQIALKAFQDSIAGENGENGEKASYNMDGKSNQKFTGSNISAKLTIFNPNTADSAKLVSLGLRPYVAKISLNIDERAVLFAKQKILHESMELTLPSMIN